MPQVRSHRELLGNQYLIPVNFQAAHLRVSFVELPPKVNAKCQEGLLVTRGKEQARVTICW